MKIVQSYWSKPANKRTDLNKSDRNLGGWLESKYNYMSWALSCLQFKKYYRQVELVTDRQGYDLLINKLELPYTKVDLALDRMDDYHPDLWALGKIFAYQLQAEPFVHADGDVFIWGAFSKALETSAVFAQNLEHSNVYYEKSYTAINQHFTYIPQVILDTRKHRSDFTSINAGILGGNNIAFIQEYTRTALDFVNRNLDRLTHIDIGWFNCIFEQYLFYCLSCEKGVKIHYELSNINSDFDGIIDFTGVPSNTRYLHALAGYKKSRVITEMVEFRLKTEHPDYYYKIIRLLQNQSL